MVYDICDIELVLFANYSNSQTIWATVFRIEIFFISSALYLAIFFDFIFIIYDDSLMFKKGQRASFWNFLPSFLPSFLSFFLAAFISSLTFFLHFYPYLPSSPSIHHCLLFFYHVANFFLFFLSFFLSFFLLSTLLASVVLFLWNVKYFEVKNNLVIKMISQMS